MNHKIFLTILTAIILSHAPLESTSKQCLSDKFWTGPVGISPGGNEQVKDSIKRGRHCLHCLLGKNVMGSVVLRYPHLARILGIDIQTVGNIFH